MRGLLLAVAFAVSTLWPSEAALAAGRVALVIGNGAYQQVSGLPNPPRDASDIAASLARLGFTVTRLTDANAESMRKALVSFGQSAQGADIAIIYYAGHGMEVNGENWLIPVDARLTSDTDIESEAVSLRAASLQVGKAHQLGLVILDACRNNPFAAKMQRSLRTRAVTAGLAPTEPTDNVLIAYSAKDGTTAEDGTGRNSPFTAALLHNIERPGLEITFLFRNVRDEVMHATNREQQPFVYGSLSSEAIYLKPVAGPTAAAPPADQAAAEAWATIKDTSSVDALESFIRHFGDSFYADLARTRLSELRKSTTVASLPSSRALSSAIGSDGTAEFGGPPFCKYTVELKNPKLSAPLDKHGTVEGATLSLTMLENAVTPCPYSGIGAKLHSYTGSGTLDDSGLLVLTFVGAPTNAPQATAQFIGKVVGNRAVGTLTVQRIEKRSILAWKVVSQFR